MAEYIKLRARAAKASVTLAFLALLGGLVGPAQGKQVEPGANASSFQWGDPIYLKFSGLSGGTKQAFLKFEYKLNQALGSLSRTINTTFYDKHKINTTFLKIDKANQEFLKIDAAGQEFLKITDAAANFLKIDSTAANSNKLGGLTPDAFVQGHANVVSGEVTVNGDGKPQALMQTPDGAILIGLLVNVDGVEFINIHNGTSAPITGVADPTAVEFSVSSGGDKQILAGSTRANPNAVPATDGSLMTHIQIFPGQSLRDVITATVSSEPQTGGQVTAVGQMLIGLL